MEEDRAHALDLPCRRVTLDSQSLIKKIGVKFKKTLLSEAMR
jgi:hypothetical protein